MDDSPRIFTARLEPRGGDTAIDGEPPEVAELIAPGDIYASVTGPRSALALEFIWKDGRSLAMPYSLQPLLWWHPPGKLLIEYPDHFTVELRGKELCELHRRIKDQRLTWLREFDEHQAAAMASAVTRIQILRCYPSHEAGL
jgi:hypothetical protein